MWLPGFPGKAVQMLAFNYSFKSNLLGYCTNLGRRSISPRLIGRFPHTGRSLPRFSGICIRRLVGGESGRLAGTDVGVLSTSFVDLLTLFGADYIIALLLFSSRHL